MPCQLFYFVPFFCPRPFFIYLYLVYIQVPEAVPEEMCLLDHGPLPLVLDVLGAGDQDADSAGLLLALGHDDGRLALLELAAPVALVVGPLVRDALGGGLAVPLVRARQAAAGAGQARGHQGGAAEDEADGAAVYADGGEGLGEAVDELEVGEQDAVVDLEEDGLAVEDVEARAVGQLHLLQGGLLGEHIVDEGRQEGVGREQRLAQRALDRGLELLLGGGRETARERCVSLGSVPRGSVARHRDIQTPF